MTVEQRADEEIGGDEKGDAGLAHTAEVHHGEQEQDAETEGERVPLQLAGIDGDERADAGGDADRGGEHVVDHQCRGGEQAGKRAQVLRCDGVGAAAVGVGIDRLAVREEDDDEQDDDGERDGDDVVHAADAQRDEQGEGGFRPVCRGGERVEAEDRERPGPRRCVLRAAPSWRGGGRRVGRKETCSRPALPSAKSCSNTLAEWFTRNGSFRAGPAAGRRAHCAAGSA